MIQRIPSKKRNTLSVRAYLVTPLGGNIGSTRASNGLSPARSLGAYAGTPENERGDNIAASFDHFRGESNNYYFTFFCFWGSPVIGSKKSFSLLGP